MQVRTLKAGAETLCGWLTEQELIRQKRKQNQESFKVCLSIVNENSVCHYTGEQNPRLQGSRRVEICAFAASEMLNAPKAVDSPLYTSRC